MPARKHTWSLSQDICKNRGTCSVCLDVFQLHIKDGSVHQHGPRSNRCPGSHKPPLSDPTVSSSQPPATVSVPTDIPTSSPSSSQEPQLSADASSCFDHPRLSSATIKHIPKSARPACAVYLIKCLDRVQKNTGDLEAWSSLLSMGEVILQAPKRSGKKHNLASLIKKRVGGVSVPVNDVGGAGQKKESSSSKSRSPENALAALVTSKIEDGNLRAAVRLLCSEEKLAENNDSTYRQLCLKHPTGQSPVSLTFNSDSSQVSALEVSEAEVLKAVEEFSSRVSRWSRWGKTSAYCTVSIVPSTRKICSDIVNRLY